MISAEGMKVNDVRCDVCGATAHVGASCGPGLPCGLRRSMATPRCPGTWRTKAEVEAATAAMEEAMAEKTRQEMAYDDEEEPVEPPAESEAAEPVHED
jgi:hypothetical protein